MARLVFGILPIVVFVLSLSAALFSPTLSVDVLLLAGAALLVPGIALVIVGLRRFALIRKVGPAVLTAARETGHIYIADIAAGTRAKQDEVRMVVTMLSKRRALPRDVEVS
jgi:hypothetical protein